MTFETISCTSDVRDYAREIVEAKSPMDARGFYIVHLKDVLYKVRLWKDTCPRIQPFYGMLQHFIDLFCKKKSFI